MCLSHEKAFCYVQTQFYRKLAKWYMDIMRMTKLVLIITQGSIFPSQIQTTSTTIKAVWHFFWATQFSVQFKPCHAVHTVWLKVTVLGVNVALNLLLIMYPIYLDLRSVLNSWFFLEQMDVKKLHLRQNSKWAVKQNF